jgi:threo-3-hydroxy-L-aspartate ammonia-lyase
MEAAISVENLVLEDIRAAAARLDGVVHRTPVLTSATLDAECGGAVFLKAESFQRGGSFKFRGAYNRLSQLPAAERERGVVAYSSGNHGGAVALAARLLGIAAVIVVPSTGSAAKLAAIEGYGAELRRYDPATELREEVAASLAAERALTIVRPFDDYAVMAGQGTAGLELAQEVAGLDRVLAPVGGGGLIAGVATAVRGLQPSAEIIGVEPAAGPTPARRCGPAAASASASQTPSPTACGPGSRGS